MSDRARTTSRQSVAAARQARALLQVWLSPSFPIGTFAYSHGLEKAVECGWITSRATLEAWLRDLVAHGGLRNDLILIGEAYRTAARADHAHLYRLADLAAALQPTAERSLEATQQGQSFLHQIDAAWTTDTPRLDVIFADTQPSVPVVLGVAAEMHAIALDDTAQAYAVAFTTNLMSAAIRLSVIGQSDGQRIMAAVMPALFATAVDAVPRGLDDLGSATFRSDIASMQHETQYTRLFRS